MLSLYLHLTTTMAVQALTAMKMGGKHVYVQKPLTHTIQRRPEVLNRKRRKEYKLAHPKWVTEGSSGDGVRQDA